MTQRSAKTASKGKTRFTDNALLWNMLAGIMLGLSVCLCAYVTLLLFDPQNPLNPLPPYTRTPIQTPTLPPTNTPVVPPTLPAEWTATSTPDPNASATPTGTPTPPSAAPTPSATLGFGPTSTATAIGVSSATATRAPSTPSPTTSSGGYPGQPTPTGGPPTAYP